MGESARSRNDGSTISIGLVAGFKLTVDGRDVYLKSRKARGLLAYLALVPGHRDRRERICGLLWSDSSEDRARASLRQTLHGLREIFDERRAVCVEFSRDEIGIREGVDIDAVRITGQVAAGKLPSILGLPRVSDMLLSDLDDLDPAFGVWTSVQRQLFHRKLTTSLEQALPRATGDDAVACARALLNLDPTHEEGCRTVIRHCARIGDTTGALQAYNNLWDVLEREHDVEPSPATKELIVRLKLEGSLDDDHVVAEASVASARTPRLAPGEIRTTIVEVAPFDHAGVGRDREHLVFGIRHDLIARLVRFREWAVVDSQGAGGSAAISSSDQSRCARFSVDGTVREGGEGELFLVVTVKEQPSARYIWSESYRAEPSRWFASQPNLVSRIAVALSTEVSAGRLSAIAPIPEVALDVYERWLRGHKLLFSWNPEERSRASTMLHSVVRDAPDFTPAYCSLVQLFNSEHIVLPGVRRSAERQEAAVRLAQKAVTLDPLDSRAHLGLAWSMAMGGRFELAEMSFKMALELNPNDPWTLVSVAQGVAFCGDPRQAVELAARALQLDLNPSRPRWGYHVGIRYLCGDYEGCIAAADRADGAISNLPAWKAAALARLGLPGPARREATRFVEAIGKVWHGNANPDAQAVVDWVLHCFPIRRQEDWTRLREGLAIAGLPA